MSRPWLPEFGRFLSVGVITTLLSLLIIFASKYVLRWDDVPANALGYLIGMLLNFHLNSQWTFSYRGSRGKGLLRFAVSSLVAWLANLAVVLVLIRYVHVNSYVAHTLGIPAYTLTSYVLSRTFVFRAPAA